jgi:hypothetical protein
LISKLYQQQEKKDGFLNKEKITVEKLLSSAKNAIASRNKILPNYKNAVI